ELRLREALRVRTQVEERQRILGAELGRLFDERPLVGERGDSRPSAHRIVVAALRADPKRALELVVAVVRVTARAGVRMVGRRSRLVVGLDGYVDVRHGASLDRSRRIPVALA